MKYFLPPEIFNSIIKDYLRSTTYFEQNRHKKKLINNLKRLFDYKNKNWLPIQYNHKSQRFIKVKYITDQTNIIDHLIMIRFRNSIIEKI